MVDTQLKGVRINGAAGKDRSGRGMVGKTGLEDQVRETLRRRLGYMKRGWSFNKVAMKWILFFALMEIMYPSISLSKFSVKNYFRERTSHLSD